MARHNGPRTLDAVVAEYGEGGAHISPVVGRVARLYAGVRGQGGEPISVPVQTGEGRTSGLRARNRRSADDPTVVPAQRTQGTLGYFGVL